MSVTPQIDWLEPRSTSSHCGSENALDHRVPVLPSTALDAGKPEFSSDEAVAVLFSAAFVVPHVAAVAAGAVAAVTVRPETTADRTSAAQPRRLVNGRREDRASLARLRRSRDGWERTSMQASENGAQLN